MKWLKWTVGMLLLAAFLVFVASRSVLLPEAPYQKSLTIEAIAFDFTTSKQFGRGSDQWPMTWADDGEIYGAWGDGNGWDEITRYSMGITRIGGMTPNLTGTDIWGGNDKNRKPNGFVADGNQRMYLFYGTESDNWDGSYGMASNDNGQTWTDTGIKVFSFAKDGVLVVGVAQFGPGYTNMPPGVDGDYFYVYLAGRQSGKDRNGKEVYLSRVPKAKIFSRSAYSYFAGLDDRGNSRWSFDWREKRPVFSDSSGMAYHVSVSYNWGIGRFIYAKGHETSHLGIFEGPNLWGPWSTVYYGPFKDRYWKFTYQFPQKWMSADGLTMWMVWSGWPEYDNVNFVKTTLQLKTPTRHPNVP